MILPKDAHRSCSANSIQHQGSGIRLNVLFWRYSTHLSSYSPKKMGHVKRVCQRPHHLSLILRPSQRQRTSTSKVFLHSSIAWRNPYPAWSHGCDNAAFLMSPRPRLTQGCGNIWEAGCGSTTIAKTISQISFYPGCEKSALNKEMLWIGTLEIPSCTSYKNRIILNFKHRVRRPDCETKPEKTFDVTRVLV